MISHRLTQKRCRQRKSQCRQRYLYCRVFAALENPVMLHVLGWLSDVIVHHISVLPAAAHSVHFSQARYHMRHACTGPTRLTPCAPEAGQGKKLLQ